jgi:hypothetical protein
MKTKILTTSLLLLALSAKAEASNPKLIITAFTIEWWIAMSPILFASS